MTQYEALKILTGKLIEVANQLEKVQPTIEERMIIERKLELIKYSIVFIEEPGNTLKDIKCHLASLDDMLYSVKIHKDHLHVRTTKEKNYIK